MKAKVRTLRSELKNTKKGTRSISEYVLRIKAISDSLIAIGETVSEQDQVDTILDGLPEDYGPFVMMIYRRSESPSVADVESLLLVQEAQFEKFKTELSTGSVSVNVTQGPMQNDSRSTDDTQIIRIEVVEGTTEEAEMEEVVRMAEEEDAIVGTGLMKTTDNLIHHLNKLKIKIKHLIFRISLKDQNSFRRPLRDNIPIKIRTKLQELMLLQHKKCKFLVCLIGKCGIQTQVRRTM